MMTKPTYEELMALLVETRDRLQANHDHQSTRGVFHATSMFKANAELLKRVNEVTTTTTGE
jgi:hypothetical protein